MTPLNSLYRLLRQRCSDPTCPRPYSVHMQPSDFSLYCRCWCCTTFHAYTAVSTCCCWFVFTMNCKQAASGQPGEKRSAQDKTTFQFHHVFASRAHAGPSSSSVLLNCQNKSFYSCIVCHHKKEEECFPFFAVLVLTSRVRRFGSAA